MNKYVKEVMASKVLMMLHHCYQIRVSDVASKLYINKDKARRLLNWMISEGYIVKRTIRFGYNVKMNVYSRNV